MNERFAAWRGNPECSAVAERIAGAATPETVDDVLKLWEILAGLSADTDMLVAAACYLHPVPADGGFTLTCPGG